MSAAGDGNGGNNDDDDDDDDDAPFDPDAVVTVSITDELDLHTFAPRDAKALVADYLEAAAAKGFTEVRIVHGKGVGVLRRLVHAVLAGHPRVIAFHLAEAPRGGWGATVVTLRR